jgi:hypothetical protein
MWEAERYDWPRLRAQGSAAGVPAALEALQNAASTEEAERAYWRIDNTVVVQGALYEAAAPTAACTVIALGRCSPPARRFLLELLVQMAAGEPAPEELKAGGGAIRGACLAEVRNGVALYLDLLERGDDEERGWCGELLGRSAEVDPALRPRAVAHLLRTRDVVRNKGIRELLQNWLQRLQAVA